MKAEVFTNLISQQVALDYCIENETAFFNLLLFHFFMLMNITLYNYVVTDPPVMCSVNSILKPVLGEW